MTRRAIVVCAALALNALGAGVSSCHGSRAHDAAAAAAQDAAERSAMLAFLRDWMRRGVDDRAPDNSDTRSPFGQRTFFVTAPLDGDVRPHRAWVVYFAGPTWCAGDARGCTVLVVARDTTTRSPAYRVIGDIGGKHLPVAVLPSRSHGWPDLAAWDGQCCTLPPIRVRLRYDGKQYEGDTSAMPSRSSGRVILSDTMRLALLDSLAPPDSITIAWRNVPPVHWTGLAGHWAVAIPGQRVQLEAMIGDTPPPDAAQLPSQWPGFRGSGVLTVGGRRWQLPCTLQIYGYTTDTAGVADSTHRDLELECGPEMGSTGGNVSFAASVPSTGVVPDTLVGSAEWWAPFSNAPDTVVYHRARAVRH